ncbi:hypothetical protein NC652_011524 [Populus alba x Populus x berolinensis]|nr:hypothetical protein NC652_011524 [Populus alba x Populus x berolinensis]
MERKWKVDESNLPQMLSRILGIPSGLLFSQKEQISLAEMYKESKVCSQAWLDHPEQYAASKDKRLLCYYFYSMLYG